MLLYEKGAYSGGVGGGDGAHWFWSMKKDHKIRSHAKKKHSIFKTVAVNPISLVITMGALRGGVGGEVGRTLI